MPQPIQNHFMSPVMKLPLMYPSPWPTHTRPVSSTSTAITARPILTADRYRARLRRTSQAAVDDRLLLRVLKEGLDAVLLAEAGLLGATERQLVVRDLQGVDPRVARLDLLHGPMRGGHVRGPDRRAEAERRVVREPQALVEVLDPPHRQRRAEDLLGPHARAVGYVLEDRRLDEPSALVVPALGPAAAEDGLRSAVERVLDLRLDLRALHLRVHRAHAAVLVETVAGLELRRAGDELLHQPVVRAFLDVEALDGEARLAAVEEPADRDRARRRLQVGVVKHDARVAA